ncbi:MAG: hypothetical protein U9Q92_02665 [archaeon]|nr:hypothetical protein [archaeon]
MKVKISLSLILIVIGLFIIIIGLNTCSLSCLPPCPSYTEDIVWYLGIGFGILIFGVFLFFKKH